MQSARDFAQKAHTDAGQSYNGHPYVVHLDDVAAILTEYGFTDDTHQATAFLHDVLEDTPTTSQHLTDAGFPILVIRAVEMCTDAKGMNRKERKAVTYRRVETVTHAWMQQPEAYEHVPVGLTVKLADRLANLRSCVQTGSSLVNMYRREREDFKRAYYVPGICDAMWAEYDRILKR